MVVLLSATQTWIVYQWTDTARYGMVTYFAMDDVRKCESFL